MDHDQKSATSWWTCYVTIADAHIESLKSLHTYDIIWTVWPELYKILSLINKKWLTTFGKELTPF